MAELRLGNDVVIPQAYDPLRPFAVEVDAGKQLIANAINDKGGEASADESFNQLATDITNIPTNIQVEDAANLAFPESIAWNILKEAYTQQRVGYASWIVAEFFKGYDTIPLSGADAFYTCDGDFYTEATTHTWHDESYNKVNRFVVYYFTGENVPFSVTQESLCPRSMAVMGKFGSINIASAGRIRQIYNGGEINDISFASTNPWCDEVLLAGVKEHNSGYILNANANVQMFASDIEVLNGGRVINGANTKVTTIILTKLKTLNNGYLIFGNDASLISVNLPELEIINGGGIYPQTTSDSPNFSTLLLPKLKILNSDLGGQETGTYYSPYSKLTTLDLSSLEVVNNASVFKQQISTSISMHNFYFPSLREINNTTKYLFHGYMNQPGGFYGSIFQIRCPKLEKGATMIAGGCGSVPFLNNCTLIEIGEDYNGNINWQRLYFTNSIRTDDNSLVDEGETFANNREKFLYNFEKYIVDKLADNSESGLSFTLTLKSAVYNVVSATQSITDKLTAKHWNLASA